MYMPATTATCKRRYERRPLKQAARFKFANEKPLTGTIMDMSYEGIFLNVRPASSSAASRPDVKSRLNKELVVALKVNQRVFKFMGRVTRQCGKGLGVKLLNTDPKRIAALVRLLRTDDNDSTQMARSIAGGKPAFASRRQSKAHGSSTIAAESASKVTLSKADKLKLKQRTVSVFRRAIAEQLNAVLAVTQNQVLQESHKHLSNIFDSTGEWLLDATILGKNGQWHVNHYIDAVCKILTGYIQNQSPLYVIANSQPKNFSQLELVTEKALSQTVLLESEANIMERSCDGALLELHVRFQELLGLDANEVFPLRPSVLAEVFSRKIDAWRISEPAQQMLAQAFVDSCIKVIPKVYQALNKLLVDAGSNRDITKHAAWQTKMRDSVRSSFETASRQLKNENGLAI